MQYKYQKFVPYDIVDNVNMWVNKTAIYEKHRVPEEPIGYGDSWEYVYLKLWRLLDIGVDPRCLQVAIVAPRASREDSHTVLLVPCRVKKGLFWNRKETESVFVMDNRWDGLYTFMETEYILKRVYRVPVNYLDRGKA